MSNNWRDSLEFPFLNPDDCFDSVVTAMVKECIENGDAPTKSWFVEGDCKDPQAMVKSIREHMDMIYDRMDSKSGNLVKDVMCFSRDEAFLCMDFRNSGNVVARLSSIWPHDHDHPVVKILQDSLQEKKVDEHRLGPVFALVRSGNSLKVAEIGKIGHRMKKSNYTPDVVEAMSSIRKNLRSREPDGRLTILSGEPGTGKTHLIMDLARTKDIVMVLIDPRDASEMSGPDIMSAMTRFVNDYDYEGKKPVLVMEDGDAVLVRRAADNMSSISAMLNMCDGLRGKVMDFRLIVTTNARKLDMDEAIMRPGRLHRHVLVDKLSPERAAECLASLVPGTPTTFSKPMSLAEVYRKAREEGWKPKRPKGSKAGSRRTSHRRW